MKQVFVAATRQNDGKTSVSLGLFHALQKRYSKMGYMKPVGQQYYLVNGKKIDKDAVLFQSVYNLADSLTTMSPIAVPAGFTENYILNGQKGELAKKIKKAHSELSKNKDLILIEGTGHGGVGSVFDMSNGDVASLLNSKVILVALGGIGRSIDEIMLNKALFEQKGCTIAGVIINKINPDKYDKVQSTLSKGLARQGLHCFGMIPWVNLLTKPSVAELYEDLDAELLGGKDGLQNTVEKFVIGAMLPHDAMDYFSPNTLLIVPANREDLIMTALYGNIMNEHMKYNVSAIVFTGGIRPHPKLSALIEHAQIPMMLVQEDTFSIASKINSMIFKLRSEESEKIAMVQHLVDTYVDVDGICERL